MLGQIDNRLSNIPFVAAIRRQSAHLLDVHNHLPRLGSIFSNQHRWLMAHIGLSLYFESLENPCAGGLHPARFIKQVAIHQVTSRNTASAFLSEMLNYGIIIRNPQEADRRKRALMPAPQTLAALETWLLLHLSTLDELDAGSRCARYEAELMPSLQPAIADGLLRDNVTRNPNSTFAHFMWMNSGFLITERLMVSLGEYPAGDDRLATNLTSIAELTAGLNLSRAHSARKINEAQELGILGWTGTKGRSPMWASRTFIESFLAVQAAKLGIIGQAFDRVLAERGS
jgi:hypothetical protein